MVEVINCDLYDTDDNGKGVMSDVLKVCVFTKK